MTLTDISQARADTILVTGYPSFTAERLVARIARQRPDDKLVLLTSSEHERATTEWLSGGNVVNASVLVGDVASMDLGLSGTEYSSLCSKVTSIHHLAQVRLGGGGEQETRRTNITGTKNVISMAKECARLRRLTHWSTAFVSGKRKGVILEEELDCGQGFNNYWEQTKLEAERLTAAAKTTLPVTIVRPSIIVGDSKSGAFDQGNPANALMVAAVSGQTGLRVPLPAHSWAPMHVAPIDFISKAGLILSIDERGAGGTFHLTDANALSCKRVLDLLADASERGTAPTLVSPTLARTVLRTPGLARLTLAPRAILDALDRRCNYNSRKAEKILNDYGVHCPPFDDYVEALVTFSL